MTPEAQSYKMVYILGGRRGRHWGKTHAGLEFGQDRSSFLPEQTSNRELKINRVGTRVLLTGISGKKKNIGDNNVCCLLRTFYVPKWY